MIKTEAQVRKLNEDLFFQYLLGIKNNAVRDDQAAWDKWHELYTKDNTDPDISYFYARYARASERLDTLEQILRVYSDYVIT